MALLLANGAARLAGQLRNLSQDIEEMVARQGGCRSGVPAEEAPEGDCPEHPDGCPDLSGAIRSALNKVNYSRTVNTATLSPNHWRRTDPLQRWSLVESTDVVYGVAPLVERGVVM